MKLFTFTLLAVWAIIASPATTLRSVRASDPAQQKEKLTSKEKIGNRDDELVRASQKEQAVVLLRNTLESSSSIEDIMQRSLLVSRAAELIWKYDGEFARMSVLKTFEQLLGKYKEPEVVRSVEKLGRLDTALNRLITTMRRNDASLAASAVQNLNDVRKEQLKESASDPSNKERFSEAQETLASNLQKSVELASRVLQLGVPFAFPQFLYDVRRVDVSSADALYSKGLNVLASGGVYRATDAIQLSAYGFRERMVLLPMPDQTEQSAKLQFGMLTRKLSPPEYNFDPSLANAYLLAADRYVTSQLAFGGAAITDQVQLVQLLFLTTKLSVYSSKLAQPAMEKWQQLRFDLEVRCGNAGVDTSTIQNIMGFAERLANADDVFQSGNDSSLDRAKDIDDEQRRNEVLVRGVWNLIQGQRFQQAEMRIKDVDDKKARGILTDLLEYYAGKASLKDRNWSDVTGRASRIKDRRISLLLLLDTAKAAKGRQKKIAKQFMLDARALVPGFSDTTDRAKSLISLASLATETYPELSAELLLEALAAINASEDYDGGDFQILVDVIPHFRVVLATPDSSLEVYLKRQAKLDWTSALRLAENLNSKSLKSLALISACEAIL